MWAVFLINWILGKPFNRFGIRPRKLTGLIGLITSPFLHGSFLHISGNTLPFVTMGAVLAIFYKNDFIMVGIGVTLLTGFCTWVLGASNSNHIGTSGVVFGLAGFIMGAGFFTKEFIPMSIAIAVVFYYGLPLLTGLVPKRSGVSYLGHWMGLLAGIGLAYLLKTP